MPRGGTWGKPYPTFGGNAFASVSNQDVLTLSAAFSGGVPSGFFDARFGPTTSVWPDARGGTWPTAGFSGGTPTISGSGTTAQVSVTSAISCVAAGVLPAPATGVSVLYVGSINGGSGFAAFTQWNTPSYSAWGQGGAAAVIAAQQFVNAGTHTIGSAIATGATVRAVGTYQTFAGGANTGGVRVSAGSLITGTVTSISGGLVPTGNGDLVICGAQVAQVIQAAIFLPYLFTPTDWSTFLTWAGTYHSYT